MFADGGADGEHILRGIISGLPAHALSEQAGGAWLCLVTELCNPREFPAKIQRWLSGDSWDRGGGSLSVGGG